MNSFKARASVSTQVSRPRKKLFVASRPVIGNPDVGSIRHTGNDA